jgi:beta-carotene 3-hydroxylase
MTVIFYALIVIATFLFMEVVTWLNHKYVMHGFLWILHKDHHQPKFQQVFEKNDVFFLIGSVPSITLFYLGVNPNINYKFFIALGVLLYGIAYFLIHDVLIHRRFKWFDKTKNRYLLGLRKAHKVHHKKMGKEDGECFGLLNVPKKFFRQNTNK